MPITAKHYKGIPEDQSSVSITCHRSLPLNADPVILYDLRDGCELWNGGHLPENLGPFAHRIVVSLK